MCRHNLFMGDSLQKAFVGVIALSLAVIAVELIPVSRRAELEFQCARLKAAYAQGKLSSKDKNWKEYLDSELKVLGEANKKLSRLTGLSEEYIASACKNYADK